MRAAPEDSVFLDSEVDVRVAPMPGNTAPRYPEALRAARITGEVLGAFVVDTNGRALRGSFGVLRITDRGFIDPILEALPNFKFYPARRAGKRVVQRVIMPFVFSLTR
jgi:outer membrane biosynthesis protein TonB